LAGGASRGYASPEQEFVVIRELARGEIMRRSILIAGLMFAATAAVAQTKSNAPAPTAIAQYGDWGVYASQAARTKVCYALAQPKERQPAGLNRDPGYLFIATRPGENVNNEVSVTVGFPIKEGSEAQLEVGDGKFSLYTKGDGAWVRNAAEEARLVDTLRKGRELVVKATSIRGNVTTDRYTLAGLAQALDRVGQECR
jgi:invasion protein IalB